MGLLPKTEEGAGGNMKANRSIDGFGIFEIRGDMCMDTGDYVRPC